MSEGRNGAVDFPVLRNQRQDDAGNFQTTLRNRIGCAGVGLHSGQQVRFTVYPAKADSGIIFQRTDLRAANGSGGQDISVQAHFSHISNTQLGSTLTNAAGVSVATVEHLMAAFAGCGIDNARVDLDGPELPVLDGSSAPFVMLLECAGVTRLAERRRYIRILETIRVAEDGKHASLSPFDGSAFDIEIEFPSALIGKQSYAYQAAPDKFKTEIAPARTFGFLQEVDHLKSIGLARGGSLHNALVLDGDTLLNEGGLRFPDEFARHKILDAIGDLYLAGAPIIGRFEGIRTGHSLNHKLLLALFNNPQAWEYVDGPLAQTAKLAARPLPLRRAARG